MESSIAEFLMRQLASEQLPTSHACNLDARRLARAWKYHSPHYKRCALGNGPRTKPHSQAAVSMDSLTAQCALPLSR